MPLIKHNKNNDLPENVQGVNTVGNADQMNMPQNQFAHNTGAEYHHGLHPATRPSGIHDSAALNAPGATTNVDGVTIPAAGAARKHTAGTNEKAFLGKLEHAAGTILCSSTLRAKGIRKEKEAQALKVQAAELNAAEHLEQEGRLRRERAVAHGADPIILQQGPKADMSTAVDSGVPNLAGVGAGSGPGYPGGIPQANLNTTHVPQTNPTGVGLVPGGGAIAGQQVGTAPQGMMGGVAPQASAQQTTVAPHATHMMPQGQPGMGSQQVLQGQTGNYPLQRQDIVGEPAYNTQGVGVH